jgi:hypothetical protein
VVAVVMVLKHDKEVARKITLCECLRMGNDVVIARLCDKNKCVVASSVVTTVNLFTKTPGNTFKHA